MAEINTDAGNLNLIGGRLCLDFANTVDWRAGENPKERLTDYRKLLDWSRHAAILSDEKKELLLEKAQRFPDKATYVHGQALEFREAVYRVFCDIAAGRHVNPADLIILNAQLRRASGFLEVRNDQQDHFVLDFEDTAELDLMLWPLVQSAADLLASSEVNRVKQCEGGACGWLFLDTSRNRSRRWCSMEDCGNREKARRHYRKKRDRP